MPGTGLSSAPLGAPSLSVRKKVGLGVPVATAALFTLALLYLALLLCSNTTDHLRYRLTVEAVVDGKPTSASSVIGVDRTWKRRFDLFRGKPLRLLMVKPLLYISNLEFRALVGTPPSPNGNWAGARSAVRSRRPSEATTTRLADLARIGARRSAFRNNLLRPGVG
jgi:hypothetical protein